MTGSVGWSRLFSPGRSGPVGCRVTRAGIGKVRRGTHCYWICTQVSMKGKKRRRYLTSSTGNLSMWCPSPWNVEESGFPYGGM